MTPIERARLIDKEEFEAECQAVRQRAFAYAAALRAEQASKYITWLRLPIPEPKRCKLSHFQAIMMASKRAPRAGLAREAQARKEREVQARREREAQARKERETQARLKAQAERSIAAQAKRERQAQAKQERAEQRRLALSYTFDGKTHTLTEWSRITGIGVQTLHHRLKSGWTVERVLSTPPENGRSLTLNGETRTVHEWAKIRGLNKATIYRRLSRGMSAEEALA